MAYKIYNFRDNVSLWMTFFKYNDFFIEFQKGRHSFYIHMQYEPIPCINSQKYPLYLYKSF